MTREEIEAAYDQLTKKAGDVYFVIDTLTAQLQAATALQTSYKQERERLQKALQMLATDATAD